MDCSWCQSVGGDSIPHTLPGSSKVRPRIQNFSYFPGLIQFTTRATTLRLTGSPSNRIAVPISSGRPKRVAHPWGFTRRVTPASENGLTGSRLVMVSGIWRLILVPRRGSGKNLCSGGSSRQRSRHSSLDHNDGIGMFEFNFSRFDSVKGVAPSVFRRIVFSRKHEKGHYLGHL
jgi:hypothetical protein